MKTHEFTIIASGLDPFDDAFENTLFEAGCSDATVSLQKGVIVLDFAREASSFEEAVLTAIRDVRSAGATVDHVEPDYLVSLSDIAKRTGLTRAAVHNYAKGERKEGFPLPIARVTTESALWDWVEVSEWLCRHGRLAAEACSQAKFVRDTNVSFRQRQMSAETRDKNPRPSESRPVA